MAAPAAASDVAPGPHPEGRPCLTVRLHPDGPELLRVHLPAANPVFSVAFRHSVEKTVVVEHFRIVEEQEPAMGTSGPAMVLVGTEYPSLGAGLPPEGELQQGPDGPTLAAKLWRRLDTLVIRVMPMTEHTLILPDGRRVALAERVAQALKRTQRPAPPSDQGAALQLVPACGDETGEGSDG